MRILGTADTRLPFYNDWVTQVSLDNPYGWFRLNENPIPTSTIAIDNGSAATNGTYTNVTGLSANQTPLTTYSGNKALSFNGTATPYIALDSTVFGTNMMANNAFSAEMIFSIDTNTTSEKATAGRQNADATGWGLLMTVTSDNFLYVTGWAGNIFQTGIDGATGIPWVANKAYHVVFTCDSIISRFYVNGVERNSRLISGQPYTIPTTTGGYVGALSSFASSFDRSRNSKIDEIVYYRSVLSASTVADHAAAAGLYFN
jgi:hypothetical protein